MNADQIRMSDEMSDALYDGNTAEFIRMYREWPEMRGHDPWLYLAARFGNADAVEFLLGEGHSANERSDDLMKTTALCVACGEASPASIRLLLEAGASIDVESFDDNALLRAITGRSLECVQLLADAGIDIHKTYELEDGRLRNALEFSEHWGCPEIAEYLRSKGAVLPKTTGIETTTSSIISVLAEQLRTEKPGSLGTFSLGSEYGQAELLVFDMGSADFPCRTVLTNGLAKHQVKTPAFDEEGSRIELIMHLPFTWPLEGEPQHDSPEYRWPLEWIRLLPQGIVDGTIPLPGTHLIISNAEPSQRLGTGTEQSCLLLIADFYPFLPIAAGNSSPIHFYHVVPLYTEERSFEKDKGIQPLLEAMAEHGLQSLVVRPDREPFV